MRGVVAWLDRLCFELKHGICHLLMELLIICTQCCFSCTNRAWRSGHHNEVYLAMDSAGFEEGAELERIGLTRVHISSFHVNSNDPRLFGDRTVERCHTRGVRRSFSPQRVHLEWRRKIRTDNEIIWLRLHHERGTCGGNGRCTAASRGGTTSRVVGVHISSGTGRNVAAGAGIGSRGCGAHDAAASTLARRWPDARCAGVLCYVGGARTKGRTKGRTTGGRRDDGRSNDGRTT